MPLRFAKSGPNSDCQCSRQAEFKLLRRYPCMLATDPPEEAKLSEQLRSDHQPTQVVALIALPQLPSQTALSLLYTSDLLNSPRLQVRITAVTTLGKLGVLSETPKLMSVLTDMEQDYSVRAAAANALGELLSSGPGKPSCETVDETVTALLRTVTEDKEFIVRYAAVVSLGDIGSPAALPLLTTIAENVKSPALETIAAVAALGEVVGSEDVHEGLIEVVTRRAMDREDLVRAAAAKTLGRWKSRKDAKAALERMKGDESKYGNSPIVLAALTDALDKNE